MCFSEFIGYTCGHTSPEVLRPCPMTTNIQSNPICSQYGRRPILAQAMCPACQRILHGRAVMILEWEHHWMHQRGVCGCPVQFPDLIRPRVMGQGHPSEPSGAKFGIKADNKGKMRMKETYPAAENKMQGSDNGTTSIPPIYQENITSDGGDGRDGVSIRIPSFYGVEWIEDHRQLHNNGSCKCGGDFSFYKTPEVYRTVLPSAYNDLEQATKTGNPFPSNTQLQSLYYNHELASNTNFSNPNQQQDLSKEQYNQQYHVPSQGHYGLVQPQQTWDGLQAQQYQVWNPDQPRNLQQADQGWALFGQETGNTYQGTQPWGSSSNHMVSFNSALRSPGAIYEVDPAKSTNPLYNYACREGAKMDAYADYQTVEYPKPKDGALPLVGLPIGAGPEGPPLLSHVRTFEDCVLREKEEPVTILLDHPITEEARLGLLLRKSNSVSCLYKLKTETRSPPGAPGSTASAVGSEAWGCEYKAEDDLEES